MLKLTGQEASVSCLQFSGSTLDVSQEWFHDTSGCRLVSGGKKTTRNSSPSKSVILEGDDAQLHCQRLTGFSELEGRSDILRQSSPKLSGDLGRSSGLVVVSYLSSPADSVLDPSGSTDGVVKVP